MGKVEARSMAYPRNWSNPSQLSRSTARLRPTARRVRKSRPQVDANVTDLLSMNAVLRLPRWPERTASPKTSRMVCCVIWNPSHGYVATSRAVSCQTDTNPLMIGWDNRNVKGKSHQSCWGAWTVPRRRPSGV